MDTLFLLCAVVGGSVMVLQFVMTLMGLGDDGADVGDVGDVGDGDIAGVAGADTADGGGVKWTEAADADVDNPYSSWLFGVLSFRTVVAALAFFGMAGKASLAADLNVVQSLLIAALAGAAAMYGIYALMQAIYRLRAEGNVRIRGAVGKHGTVYVPIPASSAGLGKIQINLQNRTMEYQALTSEEEKLPTGATIVVTRVVDSDTVAVKRSPQAAPVSQA